MADGKALGLRFPPDYLRPDRGGAAELPADRVACLVKIYLTYDTLKLDDRETLAVMETARREGAMTMIHAENHDIIAYLTDKLLAAVPRNSPGGPHRSRRKRGDGAGDRLVGSDRRAVR